MAHITVFGAAPSDPDPRAHRRLADAARRGTLIRLTAGRYVEREAFESASAAERHRARVEAVAPNIHPALVISHESAVAMLGLPWLGEFPTHVVATDPRRATGQRRAHLQKVGGAGRPIACASVGGLPVTTLVVTGVDVALRASFRTAVVVLDAVLARGVPQDALLAELRSREPRPRASTRARRAIEFADAAADSPGESVARLCWAEAGFPPPVLQQEFRDAAGLIGRVDFWFEDAGVVVEFDGLVKYRDRTMRAGRSPERVVIDEKLREDRLRAHRHVRRVVRVTWPDVEPGGNGPVALEAAGVRRVR